LGNEKKRNSDGLHLSTINEEKERVLVYKKVQILKKKRYTWRGNASFDREQGKRKSSLGGNLPVDI